MRGIQVQEFGGPEVLQVADVPTPEPGPGQVLVRVTRAGINYADTHQRRNEYLAKAELPLIPGTEVAGVREDTGERVVAVTGTGGYAEYAVAPEALTVPLPDGGEAGPGPARPAPRSRCSGRAWRRGTFTARARASGRARASPSPRAPAASGRWRSSSA